MDINKDVIILLLAVVGIVTLCIVVGKLSDKDYQKKTVNSIREKIELLKAEYLKGNPVSINFKEVKGDPKIEKVVNDLDNLEEIYRKCLKKN